MADLLKFTLLLTSLTFPLVAKDYGIHGQTFPINEEDLIDYIQSRISSLDDSKVQEYYSRSFQNPQPVLGLVEAQTCSVHYFDPTVITKVDINDGEGKTIIAKGTSYNPFDQFSLNQDLLFFDGTQDKHVQWAKSYGKESKWILIKGTPLELEESENRPVFFDQYGSLVQKLSIKAIPARVTQEGKRLKIETVPIKEAICAS